MLTIYSRRGQSEDIAKAAVFLASDDVAWITGEQISVSGGKYGFNFLKHKFLSNPSFFHKQGLFVASIHLFFLFVKPVPDEEYVFWHDKEHH